MAGIKVSDDKKGKHQSFTASLEHDGHLMNGHFSFEITGYGATEDEALASWSECARAASLAIAEAALSHGSPLMPVYGSKPVE